MLKLVGSEKEPKTCPTCNGLGRIRAPKQYIQQNSSNMKNIDPATGHPIPCPECKGKKVV